MFKFISSYKALSRGAKLWVLSFEPEDFWFKKINWQLKFLLCSPLSDHSLDRPVLISVKGEFPACQILCLPKNEKDWVTACHQNWKKLGQPSLRVFLPQGMDPDTFSAKWPEEKNHDVFSCVSAHHSGMNFS